MQSEKNNKMNQEHSVEEMPKGKPTMMENSMRASQGNKSKNVSIEVKF